MFQKTVTRFVAKFNQTQLPGLLFSHQKCTRRISRVGNPRCSTCKGKTSFAAIAGCKLVIVVNFLETNTQFCRRSRNERGKETVYVKEGDSFSSINSCYHSAKHDTSVIMYIDHQVKNQNILNSGVIMTSRLRLV